MKVFSLLLIIVSFSSCRSSKGKLESEIKTLELEHISFACDCADWIKVEDSKQFSDSIEALANSAMYIEPADSSLILPDTLGYNGDRILFTGQFYTGKGFPKSYRSIESPDKAKVFRYTKYQIVQSNYRESQKSN